MSSTGQTDQPPTDQPGTPPEARSHEEDALALLRRSRGGALATLEANHFPYVSYVEIAVSDPGEIYLLMSHLAVHTRNVLRDNRVALVIVNRDEETIVATERATFQGYLTKLEEKPASIRELFLLTHPHSESYIDFTDFYFFKLEVDNVRYIKGFGEMSRFKWKESDNL